MFLQLRDLIFAIEDGGHQYVSAVEYIYSLGTYVSSLRGLLSRSLPLS